MNNPPEEPRDDRGARDLPPIVTGSRGLLLRAGLWLVSVVALAPTLPESLVTFACLVIIPLGIGVLGAQSPRATSLLQVVGHAQLPSALLVAVSFAVRSRVAGVLLALPWLMVTVLLASVAAVRFIGRASRGARTTWALDELATDAALAFTLVAGVAIPMASAGWTLGDYAPILVVLGAVHFNYAGFALGAILRRVRRALPGFLSAAAVGLWLVGTPAVAVGISKSPALEWVAAVTVAVAGLLVAGLQCSLARRFPGVPFVLMGAAGLALALGMVLAGGYGLSERFGFAWLSLPQMERVHGIANAFGFALGSLVAWRLVDSSKEVAAR